jgi:prepilin-type N-terminal cleavage/methylation domain-containing protein
MKMRRGFTLLELAMVLVVSSLMIGFGLQVTQSSNSAGCYVSTRAQVESIREGIERFARSNDRLPMPAARNVGVESANYGREALAAAIDQVGGVSWGALPFQALGLSPSMGGDCWGNKLTYVVTTALTTNNSSGGYLDNTVLGNITLKTSTSVNSSTSIAYAVISHGDDQLGAVEINYSGVSKGWCTGTDLKHTNCTANAASAAGAEFNDGKDAAANYFDDIVVAAQKPQMINAAESNAYCWGLNSTGQVGDGSTTSRSSPTLVKGGLKFASITNGSAHTCGITHEGKGYCWGSNSFGALGIGTCCTNTSEPRELAGGFTFNSISAGDYVSCALTSAGAAYCWGYNGSGGNLGLGHGATPVTTPQPVTGGLSFKSISADFATICGVTTTGVGYCWGDAGVGRIGDNTTINRNAPRLVSDPLGGPVTWATIQTGSERTCGLTTTGAAYCWGRNHINQLGDGSTTDRLIPTAVIGGHTFQQLVLGTTYTCGLTTNEDVYCWGWRGPLNLGGSTNTPLILPSGQKFKRLSAGAQHICGTTATNETYCWMNNGVGQLGDGTITYRGIPNLIPGTGATPLFFTAMSNDAGGNSVHSCAIQPLAASWGYNNNGQVGDDTSTDRTTPVYVKMPSGVKYFTDIRESTFGASTGGGDTRCAIANTGQIYCWGRNSTGQVGDGTTVDKDTPTAVPLPAGVTSFKAVAPGNVISCGIGNNDRVYCWGSGNPTPTEVALPSVTALSIDDAAGQAAALGSNGLLYNISAALSPSLVPFTNDVGSPALPATAKAFSKGQDGANFCIIGSDDQIYCNGSTDSFGSLGDGSVPLFTTTPALSFVKVTNPGGVASFKSISVGHAGSGWGFACAIADNNQIYCWGSCSQSRMCGNGDITTLQTVPTLVSLPTGVTGWRSVFVGSRTTTAIGDDGNAYYWGASWAEDHATPGYSYAQLPTLIPLPPGASGFQSINGRVGITR